MVAVKQDRTSVADLNINQGVRGELLSVRSFVILSSSMILGSVTGLAAGMSAGLLAAANGISWGITVGVTSGIATATVTGFKLASSLDALLGRSA